MMKKVEEPARHCSVRVPLAPFALHQCPEDNLAVPMGQTYIIVDPVVIVVGTSDQRYQFLSLNIQNACIHVRKTYLMIVPWF